MYKTVPIDPKSRLMVGAIEAWSRQFPPPSVAGIVLYMALMPLDFVYISVFASAYWSDHFALLWCAGSFSLADGS